MRLQASASAADGPLVHGLGSSERVDSEEEETEDVEPDQGEAEEPDAPEARLSCAGRMAVTDQETDNLAKWERESGIEARLLARYRERLLSELAPLGALRVLDVGCGEGLLTGWLAAHLPGAEVQASRPATTPWRSSAPATRGSRSTRATSTLCRSRTAPSTSWWRWRCSSISRIRPPRWPRCAACPRARSR